MTATVPYDTISTTSQSRVEPMFTRCCCCFPLRAGCFILGYINLFLNAFHTLVLLTLTTYIGISTHGFDHFDDDGQPMVTELPVLQSDEKPLLTEIGLLMAVVLCANVAWLLVIITCLIGLHKKRPGPIRVYVGFASARLLLAMAGFIYLVMNASATTLNIISQSVDLGLTGYFILVYYIYAVHLEREEAQLQVKSEAPSKLVFAYPTKPDKEILIA